MLEFYGTKIAAQLGWAMIFVASILRVRREGGVGAWLSAGAAILIMAFILADTLLFDPHIGVLRAGVLEAINSPWFHLYSLVPPVGILIYGTGMLLGCSTRRR